MHLKPPKTCKQIGTDAIFLLEYSHILCILLFENSTLHNEQH
jgi:hypothetical protein